MKMRSLLIDAGSIILWKDYNILNRLWHKLRGKALAFNRFSVVGQRTELLTSDALTDVIVYEPIRKYSKSESNKLRCISYNLASTKDWNEVVTVINLIRPNTLNIDSSVEKCKYYKKVDWNEKLDEYIY